MSNAKRVIAELVGRRAALIRERRRLYREMRAVGRELDAVRNELRKIVPRLRGSGLGGGGNPVFRHLIRDALGKGSWLTPDLALMVIRKLGLSKDKATYLATRKRVHACLKELRSNGEIVSVRVPGKPNAWTLA